MTDVSNGDGERARAPRSVERRGDERCLEIVERASKDWSELDGARRGDDAPTFAGDERIAERVAQAGEGVADRGRRDVQASGGTRDVLLEEHDVEHEHQVEVDRGKAHGW